MRRLWRTANRLAPSTEPKEDDPGGRLRSPALRVRLAAHAPNRKAGHEQGFDALRIHCPVAQQVVQPVVTRTAVGSTPTGAAFTEGPADWRRQLLGKQPRRKPLQVRLLSPSASQGRAGLGEQREDYRGKARTQTGSNAFRLCWKCPWPSSKAPTAHAGTGGCD